MLKKTKNESLKVFFITLTVLAIGNWENIHSFLLNKDMNEAIYKGEIFDKVLNENVILNVQNKNEQTNGNFSGELKKQKQIEGLQKKIKEEEKLKQLQTELLEQERLKDLTYKEESIAGKADSLGQKCVALGFKENNSYREKCILKLEGKEAWQLKFPPNTKPESMSASNWDRYLQQLFEYNMLILNPNTVNYSHKRKPPNIENYKFHEPTGSKKMSQNFVVDQEALDIEELKKYKTFIQHKIRQNVNRQLCGLNPEIELIYAISLMPTGDLLGDVRVLKSSSIPSCDEAVERAILQSQPLPLPKDGRLFVKLKNLELKFQPNALS
jgi:hypothetical protein